MKKTFTLFALAAMMAAPATTMAQSQELYVTTASEFKTAFESHPGTPGSVTKIIIAGKKDDAGNYTTAKHDVLNIGNYTPAATANADGTIIITSNQTDIDNLPILYGAFNMATQAADSHFSMVFENVQIEYRAGNLATSGQVIYWNKKDCHADSIIFRHCNITNIPRTLIRTLPSQDADGKYLSDNTLNRFVMEDCRMYDMDLTSGNNWPLIYLATITSEVTIKNNMFFNFPYSKQILTWNYCDATGNDSKITFENNLVVASKGTWKGYDGTEAKSTFDMINVGGYLGVMADYQINNNLILTPETGKDYLAYGSRDQKGAIQLVEASPSKVLACTGGLVTATNNVIEGYDTWAAGNNKDEDGNRTWILGPAGSEAMSEDAAEGRITMEEAGLKWTDFYDAAACDFRLEKSHALYEKNIGPKMMYVDKFPVKATIAVNIKGSNSVDYTITPVKESYNVGDEVTITLNEHNSYYRTLNNFLGWSDGNKDNPRTITIEGPVELTANYESTIGNLVSLMDFSKVNGNLSTSPLYSADVFSTGYQATLHYFVTDTAGVGAGTTTAPFSYVEATAIQARAAKFGEDPVAQQMPVVSRRSPAVANTSQLNYVVFAFPTTNLQGVQFSCFVGTDNLAYKTQKLEYSLDKEAWTEIGRVDLEERDAMFGATAGKLFGWQELKGTLPTEAEGKEMVYVRVIGDVTSEAAINTASGEIGIGLTDSFEYIGSVLITAGTDSGISTLRATDEQSDALYNLMGVRVAANAKGLLIKNGKKILVK